MTHEERLAHNQANTAVMNAINDIVFRELGNNNLPTVRTLINLLEELAPVLAFKEPE
jgi:hypothetical protein